MWEPMKVVHYETVYDHINEAVQDANSRGLAIKEIHLTPQEYERLLMETDPREYEKFAVPEWPDGLPALWFRDSFWVRCPPQ